MIEMHYIYPCLHMIIFLIDIYFQHGGFNKKILNAEHFEIFRYFQIQIRVIRTRNCYCLENILTRITKG